MSWTIRPTIKTLRILLNTYKSRHMCMSPTIPLSSLLRCARCSYEWTPRKDELPKRCPKCRSIKWPHVELPQRVTEEVPIMRDTPVEHSTAQLHLQALRLQLECQGNQGSQEVSAMLLEGLGQREGGRHPEDRPQRTRGRRRPGGADPGRVPQGTLLRGHLHIPRNTLQPSVRDSQEEQHRQQHKGVNPSAGVCAPWS